jgi:hypothetical protein
MIRRFALFIVMLVPSVTNAQLESLFLFNGQNAEVLTAEKKITVVTPETVQVPSTCWRQVPVGEREVCQDETRYRQECSWIPSSQRCWDDPDRVCRPVTRTRQECHGGPGRTECRDIPSRQVCVERPTREVCTTRPDGRQHCTTVGGGTHCTTVGGGRDCREVPGDRVCRTVTYTDTDCDVVMRRRCEIIPGRNDCRDIPYSVPVCRMETQYGTESYACTKTEVVNRVAEKTLRAETRVQVLTNGLVEEFPVAITIKEENAQFKAFTIDAKLGKEPKVFVVLKNKEVKIAANTKDKIDLTANLVLEVLSAEMLPIALPTAVAKASVSEASKKLVVVFDGQISASGIVDLSITHKGVLTGTRTVAEIKASYPSLGVYLGEVEGKAALSIDLTNALKRELKKKNMRLRLKLMSPMNLGGELLNAAKPETSKLYEGTFVELK